MAAVDKYTIDYQALKSGMHTFDFEVDDALFAEMESNEIKGGCCKAHVVLGRAEAVMTAEVSISGEATVECDRCLDDCQVPVDFAGKLTIRFSETVHDYDGEQMWIARGEELSLAQYIYESIVVSLPYRRVHPEGGCDPDMLARFTPAEAQEE